MKKYICILLLVLLSLSPLSLLCDEVFNLSPLHCRTAGGGKVKIENDVSLLSGYLKLESPAVTSTDMWPSWQFHFQEKDWNNFDRVVIPIYCSSPEKRHRLSIGISGKAGESASMSCYLAASETRMIILQMKKNRKRINSIRISTCNPLAPFSVYVGPIHLLSACEDVPELPAIMKKSEDDQKKGKLSKLYADIKEKLESMKKRTSHLRSRSHQEFLSLKIESFLDKMHSGKLDYLLLCNGLDILDFKSLEALFASLENNVSNLLTDKITVGYAFSTDKVLPAVPVFYPLSEKLKICVARNERESLQLVIRSLSEDIKDVEVVVSDFKGPKGKLPVKAIKVIPVGFVETKIYPPYSVEHIGDWPDPLLPFITKLSIPADRAQPYWIQVTVPENQCPGMYEGSIAIKNEGKDICVIPLDINIWNFSLPTYSLLPLSITFKPESVAPQVLKKHPEAWAEMLWEHYIHPNNIYNPPPDNFKFKKLKKLLISGNRNLYLNLGYSWYASENPANSYGMAATLKKIRPGYEAAKSYDVVKNTYVYGWDEMYPPLFPKINRAASVLKKAFPGIRTFTTARDNSYGMDGKLSNLDWFCPEISVYNATKAEQARKQGKQVWWYICNYPTPPFPNAFVESHGMELRLLMGAMSIKYKPDGFLYYNITRWPAGRNIVQGPYTGYDALSFGQWNGDGRWCYPGPDYTPLSTIRLEQFRDGLEDYAYVKILEKHLNLARKYGKNIEWQNAAEKALDVPENLVRNLCQYTKDYDQLNTWRLQLARLIDTAPVKADDRLLEEE